MPNFEDPPKDESPGIRMSKDGESGKLENQTEGGRNHLPGEPSKNDTPVRKSIEKEGPYVETTEGPDEVA